MFLYRALDTMQCQSCFGEVVFYPSTQSVSWPDPSSNQVVSVGTHKLSLTIKSTELEASGGEGDTDLTIRP